MTNQTVARVSGKPSGAEVTFISVLICLAAILMGVGTYVFGSANVGWVAFVLCILFSLTTFIDLLGERYDEATLTLLASIGIAILTAVAFSFAGKAHVAPMLVMLVYAIVLGLLAALSARTMFPEPFRAA